MHPRCLFVGEVLGEEVEDDFGTLHTVHRRTRPRQFMCLTEYLVTLGSVERLFISTQRENQAVIAAWQKLGLEPFLTLETYHVMRRIGV